jgi:hypothetical protein
MTSRTLHTAQAALQMLFSRFFLCQITASDLVFSRGQFQSRSQTRGRPIGEFRIAAVLPRDGPADGRAKF